MTTSSRRTKTTNITPLTRALARRLRSVAGEAMLSQADIARKTGYNPKQISLWFRGMQVMTLDEAESMFGAAGARFVDEYVRAKELVRQGAEAGDLAHDGQTDDDSTAGGSAAM